MRKELNPHRVFWNTNMAAVFLFCTPILLPGRHVKKVYLEELKIFPQQWRIQGEGPRPSLAHLLRHSSDSRII